MRKDATQTASSFTLDFLFFAIRMKGEETKLSAEVVLRGKEMSNKEMRLGEEDPERETNRE